LKHPWREIPAFYCLSHKEGTVNSFAETASFSLPIEKAKQEKAKQGLKQVFEWFKQMF
jgi:hypothetical protein